MTLFSRPMIRHDARVSVLQAFNTDEVKDLRTRAGLDFTQYYRHFAHRFVLAGEKTQLCYRRSAKLVMMTVVNPITVDDAGEPPSQEFDQYDDHEPDRLDNGRYVLQH